MAPRVWFITGCSSGFGQEMTLEALKRGDKVIATARNPTKVQGLKDAGADILGFDVTASLDSIKRTVEEAHGIHGRIDIVVNNAAYVREGAMEELSPEETYETFHTNVFGPVNVIRAVAPYMRQQRSGTIANLGSIAGWGGFPGCGLYNSTKAAFSSLSDSIRQELEPFGIVVTAIEPGYFRSNLLHAGNRSGPKNKIDAYTGTVARQGMAALDQVNDKQPGDVVKGCKVIVDILTQTGSAAGRKIPERVAIGADATPAIRKRCTDVIESLEEWKDITANTNHDDVH